MEAETIDANTAVESSTTANEDVKDTSTESSAVETQDTKKTEKTIADVAKEAFDKAMERESSTAEVEGQETVEQTTETTEEATQETEEAKKGTVKEDTKPEDKKTEELPPFHEHPRWKEVTAQRDEYKQQLDTVKPVVEAHQKVAQFCEANGITPQEYNEVLEMAALSKRDPIAFHNKLKEVVAKMATEAGDALSPELQKAVDDGEMTLAWAQKLARKEAQEKLAQRNVKMSVEQRAADAQKNFRQQVSNSLVQWKNSTAGTDPDFVEGSPKFRVFMSELSSAMAQADVKTPADAVALAVKSYETANEILGRVVPKNGATRKPLSSTKSSTTAPKIPKTIAEVVRATAAKHGL